jgi:hypothetical protein
LSHYFDSSRIGQRRIAAFQLSKTELSTVFAETGGRQRVTWVKPKDEQGSGAHSLGAFLVALQLTQATARAFT